ncbi:MAG TPA: hypothetical protein DHV28_11310 [Ignavibacteriales bacterium]|nr:hypothetical protein [Ignavibacteriales bacterium]
MSILNELPNNISVTVSKRELVELFNNCLLKIKQEQAKVFPEHLSIKQLSEFINYSEPAIYKMVAKAEIPCYKISGKLLFKRTEIESWLIEFKQPTIKERFEVLRIKEK